MSSLQYKVQCEFNTVCVVVGAVTILLVQAVLLIIGISGNAVKSD